MPRGNRGGRRQNVPSTLKRPRALSSSASARLRLILVGGQRLHGAVEQVAVCARKLPLSVQLDAGALGVAVGAGFAGGERPAGDIARALCHPTRLHQGAAHLHRVLSEHYPAELAGVAAAADARRTDCPGAGGGGRGHGQCHGAELPMVGFRGRVAVVRHDRAQIRVERRAAAGPLPVRSHPADLLHGAARRAAVAAMGTRRRRARRAALVAASRTAR
eukprot:ctg_1194.g266